MVNYRLRNIASRYCVSVSSETGLRNLMMLTWLNLSNNRIKVSFVHCKLSYSPQIGDRATRGQHAAEASRLVRQSRHEAVEHRLSVEIESNTAIATENITALSLSLSLMVDLSAARQPHLQYRQDRYLSQPVRGDSVAGRESPR